MENPNLCPVQRLSLGERFLSNLVGGYALPCVVNAPPFLLEGCAPSWIARCRLSTQIEFVPRILPHIVVVVRRPPRHRIDRREAPERRHVGPHSHLDHARVELGASLLPA